MNTLRTPRHFLSRAGRSLCEAVGVARFSRPALYAIDRKLERHLNFDGGFFIEAGANDGYAQSNTYYFEKIRGWSGLLIEPVPALAAECRRNRRGPVIEAALAAAARPGEWVELHFGGNGPARGAGSRSAGAGRQLPPAGAGPDAVGRS
jgi:hypothetical protein